MIRAYARQRAGIIGLYLGALALFVLVQWLYGLPLSPTLYTALMLSFLLAVCAAVDYPRFRARRQALLDAAAHPGMAVRLLPEPSGAMERGYHDVATVLSDTLREETERIGARHAEQLDYYTLWVHQIKTPIAAMRLALQGGADAALMERELFSVERYVEMALQYVRLSDLSADMVIEPVHIAPVVSQSVKKYAPLFIGGRLRVEIEGTDFTAVTDRKWLAFILEQLLSNAVKYTEQGGVRITGGVNRLTVADSGIGIRPDDLPRVFERGYTGLNGRIDQRASGLGLYMVRRVADQLGIRVEAASTLRKGTTMTLIFPERGEFE